MTGGTAQQAVEIQLNGGACLVKAAEAGAVWAWMMLDTSRGGYTRGATHPRAPGPASVSFAEGAWCTAAVVYTLGELSVWTRDGLVLYARGLSAPPAGPTVFNVSLAAAEGLSALSAMVELKSIRRWP